MTKESGNLGNINRRVMMGGLAMTPAAIASGAIAATEQKANLRHQVFFWLKDPSSVEDRDKLIAGLKTLREIDVIRELHIGVPADTEDRDVVDHSFAVSELMRFDNKEDQLAYQQHPIHLAFVAECEDLWSRVVVYDSMDV